MSFISTFYCEEIIIIEYASDFIWKMEYEGLEALDQMQKEKVQTFMAVTGVDNINLAMQFLQSCDFNLEVELVK